MKANLRNRICSSQRLMWRGGCRGPPRSNQGQKSLHGERARDPRRKARCRCPGAHCQGARTLRRSQFQDWRR